MTMKTYTCRTIPINLDDITGGIAVGELSSWEILSG